MTVDLFYHLFSAEGSSERQSTTACLVEQNITENEGKLERTKDIFNLRRSEVNFLSCLIIFMFQLSKYSEYYQNHVEILTPYHHSKHDTVKF